MKEKDNEELISEVYEKVVKAMKEKREEQNMCNCDNPYIPCPAEIIEITKHTDIEWTFRVKADTSKTKPGQFL